MVKREDVTDATAMTLPARNHYVAAELPEDHLLRPFGILARVDVEQILPGLAYTDSLDVAEMIANALNKEVART